MDRLWKVLINTKEFRLYSIANTNPLRILAQRSEVVKWYLRPANRHLQLSSNNILKYNTRMVEERKKAGSCS